MLTLRLRSCRPAQHSLVTYDVCQPARADHRAPLDYHHLPRACTVASLRLRGARATPPPSDALADLTEARARRIAGLSLLDCRPLRLRRLRHVDGRSRRARGGTRRSLPARSTARGLRDSFAFAHVSQSGSVRDGSRRRVIVVVSSVLLGSRETIHSIPACLTLVKVVTCPVWSGRRAIPRDGAGLIVASGSSTRLTAGKPTAPARLIPYPPATCARSPHTRGRSAMRLRAACGPTPSAPSRRPVDASPSDPPPPPPPPPLCPREPSCAAQAPHTTSGARRPRNGFRDARATSPPRSTSEGLGGACVAL
ncbi:hypothetical protein C8Q77DRAFT_857992 [Trametes polyzona]|nr:hypothetical protein C8Q77DRAFT_857992 [Trametes polyzona]